MKAKLLMWMMITVLINYVVLSVNTSFGSTDGTKNIATEEPSEVAVTDYIGVPTEIYLSGVRKLGSSSMIK